jgi:hypothetical protein
MQFANVLVFRTGGKYAKIEAVADFGGGSANRSARWPAADVRRIPHGPRELGNLQDHFPCLLPLSLISCASLARLRLKVWASLGCFPSGSARQVCDAYAVLHARTSGLRNNRSCPHLILTNPLGLQIWWPHQSLHYHTILFCFFSQSAQLFWASLGRSNVKIDMNAFKPDGHVF